MEAGSSDECEAAEEAALREQFLKGSAHTVAMREPPDAWTDICRRCCGRGSVRCGEAVADIAVANAAPPPLLRVDHTASSSPCAATSGTCERRAELWLVPRAGAEEPMSRRSASASTAGAE
jgi:hypothetical protein